MLPFRGVGPAAFAVRDEVRIVEGRALSRSWCRQLIVENRPWSSFAGFIVGLRMVFRDSDWTVVGLFESGRRRARVGDLVDAEVAMSAFRWTGHQSVTATLADRLEGGFAAIKARMRAPASLDQRAARAEYYAGQAATLANLIDVLGYTVAAFMAVGATFGALM